MMNQGARDRGALLLAAAELVDEMVSARREANEIEHLPGTGTALREGNALQ